MRLLTIFVVTLALATGAQAALLAVDVAPALAPVQGGFDAFTAIAVPTQTVVLPSGLSVTLTESFDAGGLGGMSPSNKQTKVPAAPLPGHAYMLADAVYDMQRNNSGTWGVIQGGDIPVIEVDIAGLAPSTAYDLYIGSMSVYRELYQLVRPARGSIGPTIASADAPFPAFKGDNEVNGIYTTTAQGVLSVDVVWDQAAAFAAFQAHVAGGGNPANFPCDTQAVVSYLVIPEPMTMSLLGLGALALIRRRK